MLQINEKVGYSQENSSKFANRLNSNGEIVGHCLLYVYLCAVEGLAMKIRTAIENNGASRCGVKRELPALYCDVQLL